MSTMFKPVIFEQPKQFQFSKENLEIAKKIIAKYPANKQQSAVMPLLDLAQTQHNNWVPVAAMEVIADMLNMPSIRVHEIATFYTMYNKQPVGKYLVQICRTTPCWLRGSDEITKACRQKLNIDIGETTSDGKFTLVEVECLGACVNAPMIQINNDYYEDLDGNSMANIIEELIEADKAKIGSRVGRKSSEPQNLKPNKSINKKSKKLKNLTIMSS